MMDRSRNVEDALPPGTWIEEFVIERALQSGGFGMTYLARDRSLGRRVAIKEYLPREWGGRRADGSVGPRSSSHEEDYRWGLARFLEEARTLARLDHARVVRVYRVIEAWGTAYMVMEYVEGRNLEETLKAEGTWPEERVRGLLDSLLPGLAQVHAAGLIHRDIKPANVMLRGDGTPVLIDFGAARYAAGAHSHSLTSVLTPGYAPHEQYQTAGKQGAWTDVYALGAVAYRALIGRAPAEATERVGAIARQQTDPLAPVSQAAGGVSESFGAAVTAALAVFSEGRPQDVSAWRAQWDAGAGGGSTSEDEAGNDDEGRFGEPDRAGVHRGTGTRSGSGRPWIRRAGHAVAYGAAALVFAAGLAFGIVNWVGGAGSTAESSVADLPDASGPGTPGGGAGGPGTPGGGASGPGTPGGGAGGPGTPGGAIGGPGTTGGAIGGPGTTDPSMTAEESEETLELDRAAWSSIQTGLAREGFDPGAPDGVPGRATRAAIEDWQTAKGLPATGYLNAASMQALRGPGLPSYSPVLGRAWTASHADENGWTDLHYAAVLNRPDLVRRLLADGAALDARLLDDGERFSESLRQALRAFGFPGTFDNWNRDGETPLYLAARYSDSVEVVGLLLDRGASLEAVSDHGTPLHYAIRNNNASASVSVAVVELLLDRGTDLEAVTGNGWTPLQTAASNSDSVAVVELLLDRGADLEAVLENGATSLHLAARNNASVEVVELLLDRGANPEAVNDNDNKPLHFAAWNNTSVAVVELLLDRGANLEAVTGTGATPLHSAAWNNTSVAVVELLLDRGANLEAVTGTGATPLHRAARHNTSAVFELLLARGANLEAVDDRSRTLLHYAAGNGDSGSVEVVELLLDRGANLQAVDDSSSTPLHYAVNNWNYPSVVEKVELLLDRGANLEATNRRGNTPLQVAMFNRHSNSVEVVELLLRRGANLEATNHRGNTPLHLAVRHSNSAEVVELLLRRGANLEATNDSGETPLDVARTDAVRSRLEDAARGR